MAAGQAMAAAVAEATSAAAVSEGAKAALAIAKAVAEAECRTLATAKAEQVSIMHGMLPITCPVMLGTPTVIAPAPPHAMMPSFNT